MFRGLVLVEERFWSDRRVEACCVLLLRKGSKSSEAHSSALRLIPFALQVTKERWNERLTSISLKSSSFSSLVVSQTCSNSISNALCITPTFSLSLSLALSLSLSFPVPLLPSASSRGVFGVKGEAGVKGDSGEGSVEGVEGKREEWEAAEGRREVEEGSDEEGRR